MCTTSLASRSAVVLDYELSPANSYCSGMGKRIARIRSVVRTVSSRRRMSGRAMELVNGPEFFVAFSKRGAFSILDASFKFARASYLVSGEPRSTVRLEQSIRGIPCLFRSNWSKRSRFMKVGLGGPQVSERTSFKRSSRSIRARSRALRSIAPDVDLDSSGSSDENEVSLARRESCADLPGVSLDL